MISISYNYTLSLSIYRAASILCCGNEDLHVELRVRTLCELVLNEKYYLQPQIISLLDTEGRGKNALVATSANFETAYRDINADLATTVFRYDCLATANYGEWSNMFHVHGLASVLKKKIKSIYPNVKQRIRPLFHRDVPPRLMSAEQQNSPPLTIMWTHTVQRLHPNWTPNHFSPCVQLMPSPGVASPSPSGAQMLPHGVTSPSPSGAQMLPHGVTSPSAAQTLPHGVSSPSAAQTLPPVVSSPSHSVAQTLPHGVTSPSPSAAQTLPHGVTSPSAAQTLPHGVSSPSAAQTLPPGVSSASASGAQTLPPGVSSPSGAQTLPPGVSSPSPSGAQMPPPGVAFPSATGAQTLPHGVASPSAAQMFPPGVSSPSPSGAQMPPPGVASPSATGAQTLPHGVASPSATGAQTLPHGVASPSAAQMFPPGVSSPAPSGAQMPPPGVASPSATGAQTLPHGVASPSAAQMSPPGVSSPSPSAAQMLHPGVSSPSPSAAKMLPPRVSSSFTPVTQSPSTSTLFKLYTGTKITGRRKQLAKVPKVTTLSKIFKGRIAGQFHPPGVSSPSPSAAQMSPPGVASPSPSGAQTFPHGVASPSPSGAQTFPHGVTSPSPSAAQTLPHGVTSPYPSAAQTLPHGVAPPSAAQMLPPGVSSSFTPVTQTPSTSTLFNLYTGTKISGRRKQLAKVPSVRMLSKFFKGSCGESKVSEVPKQASTSTELDLSDSDDASDGMDSMTYFQEESDSDSDTVQDKEENKSVSEDLHVHVTEIGAHPEYSNPLPFPKVSARWYEKQYALSIHNAGREEVQQAMTKDFDEKSKCLLINKSQVSGTLQDNVHMLEDKAKLVQDGTKKSHLLSLVTVGNYMCKNGPIVKTQDVGRLYMKEKGLSTRKKSMELYEVFAKHLNLAQIYLFQTAYLTENSHNLPMLCSFMSSILTSSSQTESLVKAAVENRLKETFPSTLRYLDSHRDRQVLKAVVAELTNTSFTSRLQGIQSRKGTASARQAFKTNLSHYECIRITSQVVRNDMTNQQQYQLTERITSKRKLQEIRTIGKGRGRKLKCEKFPELATVLSYAFGELDARDGGGVEAHPRLTIGTLYRSAESAMTTRRAREVILSLAPDDFNISLSSCYNYTQNYRSGSAQAKQHHHGKGVNAQLSLKKPPRTGVQQLVVNLHWSTANVNLILDHSQDLPQCLPISKDAKAIIPTDIAPVQRPGHSWKSRLELPDHSWDQSRTNAVTPMTFLFLKTKTIPSVSPASSVQALDLHISDSTVLQLTRTGQSVTLINLSFYEPDTTFRCLNEICYMLTITELDIFFRDPVSGLLKKEFIFVVDNGPAEQPSSPLVQMCLSRLLNFLKLDKICQTSFAEYNSKRNFVERAHAEENRVLAKHGPFSSTIAHRYSKPGSSEHIENMECVADEVGRCIRQGSFGGSSLMCFRGVTRENSVFLDEEQLQSFLSLSEAGKVDYTPSKYSAIKGKILDRLHFVWQVERDFEGEYIRDYRLINNDIIQTTTAWKDKYTTSLYSVNDVNCHRFELQPVPDFLKWHKTRELHYLPVEERALLLGPCDTIPGLFLPSNILDLCFTVVQELTEELTHQIALLSWITPHEVKAYHDKCTDIYRNQEITEREKERWKIHPQYRTSTKSQLEATCRQMRIPVTSALAKHELLKLISEKKGEAPPQPPKNIAYSGELSTIPTSVSGISTLTIAKLRSILKFHRIPIVGNKDQLVLRVHLLRHNKLDAVTAREERQLEDLIGLVRSIIRKQKSLSITHHVYRKRKYTLHSSSSLVPIPLHITSVDDLNLLFEPLLSFIQSKDESVGSKMSQQPFNRAEATSGRPAKTFFLKGSVRLALGSKSNGKRRK